MSLLMAHFQGKRKSGKSHSHRQNQKADRANCAMLAIEAMMNGAEPNPPIWPETVKILYDTEDAEILLTELKETEDGFHDGASTYTTEYHFSDRRWAILFAPGIYRNLDFEVGYYVQVAGLGTSPDDVVFCDCAKGPHVPALNKHIHEHGLSLDTFWRSAENFASYASEGMKWAVSQAAPLRRVHIGNDLFLHDGAAYASGGHFVNSMVDGHVHFGGQQQYLSRNVHFAGGATGGAWSLVFVGCSGQVPEPSAGSESTASITVLEKPRVRVEKPYVCLRKDGETFQLRVPAATSDEFNISGPHMNGELEEARDFSRVRVVSAIDPGTTYRIQEALDEGKDVVLAPGVFYLTQTLEMSSDNQVLLGLGLATLVAPPDGSPCLRIKACTAGLRIAGIMFEASAKIHDEEASALPSTLLEWGEEGVRDPGCPENPGGMFDIFCRVGGGSGTRSAIAIETMLRVFSGNVIGDNVWLWRADHSELDDGEVANYPHISPIFHQNEEHENRVETGVEIFGNDVTFFGLAVEHANGHQTVWSGDNGAVHFYQCELPYDVTRDYGTKGYRGYLLADDVSHHELYGAGVYSNFRNDVVDVATAIEYPERAGIRCENLFTVHLDNNGRMCAK